MAYVEDCECVHCEPQTRRRREQSPGARQREGGYFEADDWAGDWKQKVADQADELRRQKYEYRKANPAPSITTSTEETAVSNSRIYDAADRAVKAELDKRETERITAEKIALVDAYGEDDFADGTVIRFDKQHSRTGIAYTYTAVKFTSGDEGVWRTSSSYDDNYSRSWAQLVELLVQGPVPTASIDVMTVERTYPDGSASPAPADEKA